MDLELKEIVNEINQLLKTDFNIISFNELSPESLLQVLIDVLNNIQSNSKLNMKEQGIDITAEKVMKILRNIGYISSESDINKEDIKMGNKRTVHEILNWIFNNMEKAKLRAYLAEYLIRLNVPLVQLQNPEVSAAYKKYSELIDNFKQVHMEWEQTKKDYKIAKDLEQNVKVIEKEIKFLTSRIYDTQEKIDKMTNKHQYIEHAEQLWVENSAQEQLKKQMEEEQATIQNLDLSFEDLKKELEEIQNSNSIYEGSEGYLENEIAQKTSRIEQYPKQIESIQQQLTLLQQVVNMPIPSEDDINELKDKIDDIQNEINILSEKKKKLIEPMKDKLAPYRKELAAVTEKQQKLNETFNTLKINLQALEHLKLEKQSQVNTIIGHEVKRGSELKQYIRQLREKNILVDKHREKVASMKSEHEIQLRTIEILKSQYPQLTTFFENWKPADSSSSDLEVGSLEEMSILYNKTKLQIDNDRIELDLLTRELKDISKKVAEKETVFQELNKVYLSETDEIQKQLEQMKRELDGKNKELKDNETQWNTLQKEIELKEETLESINLSQNSSQDSKSQNQIHALTVKLSDLESDAQRIKSEKDELEQKMGERENICKAWRTVMKLIDVKKKQKEVINKNSVMYKIANGEMLTLK